MPVFGSLVGNILGGSIWGHIIATGLCFVAFSTLGVSASSERPLPRIGPGTSESKIEGFMGLGAMVVVLTVWCASQVVVALGGADRLLETEGLTRAEYARTGFFQLVMVAAVVIGLLSLLDRLTPRPTQRSKQLFAGLSALVTAETLLLVSVTYSRLSLYIDAFGLTMLRLSVACFLAWLGLVLVLVMLRVAGLGAGRGWTPMASFCLAALLTLVFGWSNPEALVAATNLERSGVVELDTQYLVDLSADAEPTIIEALDGMDSSTARTLRAGLCQEQLPPPKYGPLGSNRARAQAAEARLALACS